ncbi:MAG TPA: hypothetical protein VG963_14510, partial [Polyangiaceae bacterium]|nr:hypothetical protein [Polyangiaceae bacterium]
MTGRKTAFHFNLYGLPLGVRGRPGAAFLGALLLSSGCSIDDRETKVASGELTPRDVAQATNGGPAPSAPGGEAPGELAALPALGASSANGSTDGEVAAATTPACPGCTVQGECLASGALAPNPCLICDPARSRDSWSSNDGASCDDGQFCTVEDTCSNGVCGGPPRECDDGIGCNGVSTCDERAGACTPAVNLCDAGALCSSDGSCVTTCSGCVIDGNCIAAGVHPAGNSCLVCDPARSTTSYLASPAGTACGDSRSSACDDSDACDGSGACQTRHRADGSACSDGQACTVDDSCRAGLCAPGPLRTCPGGSTCDPSSGNCVCQEGQQRCDGNLLEVCSGGGFDLAEDCGDGRVCNAAAGRCDCKDDS